ncbi:hypothetical protein ACIBSW_20160 [Actinoplanes sp. NPDC049668]|uniref:hypothetical protein n=1 Tax=unclassified Actinoplanes TaxID=2626549 RepID=UPI0033A51EE6
MRLTFVLARRFLRNRSQLVTTLTALVSSAFITCIFVTLSALTLSGPQVAERDLGRFEYRADLGGVATFDPGDEELSEALLTAVRDAGAGDATVSMTSTEIRPSAVNAPYTPFQEADWSANPLPKRFVLTQGRWPTAPGEVAVTRADVLRADTDGRLSVLAGRQHFRVVGVADDRYADVPTYLAARGTWAAMSQDLKSAFPSLVANPIVFWSGADRDDVVSSLSDVLARRPSSNGSDVDPATLRQSVDVSILSLPDALDTRETSWIERIPAGYTVPSLALPALATLLIYALNGRRARKAINTMVSVGMQPSQATGGIALAILGWTIVASAVGVMIGAALGLVARTVVGQFGHQPLSPYPALTGPALRILLVTLVAAAAATLALRYTGRSQAGRGGGKPVKRKGAPTSRVLRDVRHVVAIAGGCAIVLQIPRLDSPAKAMILAATVTLLLLLMVPEIMRVALRCIPERGPLRRLARRHLSNDSGRAVLTVTVLAIGLGAPTGFLTLLNTMLYTAEAQIFPEVAANQIVVNGSGGYLEPPSPAVVKILDRQLDDKTAMRLRYLGTPQRSVALGGEDFGFIAAVDTLDQLESWFDRPLTTSESSVLQQGGLLLRDGSAPGPRRLVAQGDGDVVDSTRPLATTVSRFPLVDWRQSIVAIMLTPAARQLALPASDGAFFYTGVSEGEAAAAQQAVLDAGLDAREVVTHRPPRAFVPPTALYAAALGLLVLLLLTCTSAAAGQAHTLRRYLGGLITIGASPRWARNVLFLEQGVIVTLSIALAALIAVPPVVVAAARIPDFTLHIPYDWIGLIVAAYVTAVAGSTVISSRRLKAEDRRTAV